MQQVVRMDHDPPDTNRYMDIENMAVSMGTNGPVGKDGKAEIAYLGQITTRSVGDESHCPEGLIGRTHDLTKGGCNRRIIQILKDDNRRTSQLREAFDLEDSASIHIPLPRWTRSAKGRRCRKTHHGGHLGKTSLNSVIQVSYASGANLE
jgi:hypothetical protein